MPSDMEKLKCQSDHKTPKRALHFVAKDCGGIMHATSAGSFPRSRQQVKDMRRSTKKQHDYDPLLSVILTCKETEQTTNAFVRLVNAAPYPMILLAYDYTLHDIERFCTQPDNFSVFGVDPTFSLGNFDVTITTYRHLMLRHQTEVMKKSPVMIGPIFVHMRKDFSTYHFFTSALVSLYPAIAHLHAYGTDGETALAKALATTFPKAKHLRCFLHFKGNVEHKLRELGIPLNISKEIISDIMGRASYLQYGLVDAKNSEELEMMLEGVKVRWNELEKPYNSLPKFYDWLVKHCLSVITECMIQDVCQNAGLGSPPEPYYTNGV